MPNEVLALLFLALTAAVVIAIFLVLWRERTSARTAWIAIGSGAVLAAWAIVATLFPRRGLLQPPDLESLLRIGIPLVLELIVLALFLLVSPSLRQLLTNQRNLILLNLWRLVGVVFLFLMADHQMPALWALPAGIGDVIVGVAAPWIARGIETPRGRRRAVIFNLFGMADLVVAVGLGVVTSPGPAQAFHTTPTSEMVTRFPLALVPSFLVPLAFMLHVVSLWQLLGGTWRARPAASLQGADDAPVAVSIARTQARRVSS